MGAEDCEEGDDTERLRHADDVDEFDDDAEGADAGDDDEADTGGSISRPLFLAVSPGLTPLVAFASSRAYDGAYGNRAVTGGAVFTSTAALLHFFFFFMLSPFIRVLTLTSVE